MDNFKYKDNVLHVEGVNIADIAQEVGTPFYCYSSKSLEDNYMAYRHAFDKILPDSDLLICYACKSNSNIAVLKTLKKLGSGADIVSGGEFLRAQRAGIELEKIVYSGVGKSGTELTTVINAGILQLNVESVEELTFVSSLAVKLNKQVNVGLRINPDVVADTHEKIATGSKEDKFGIDINKAYPICELAKSLPNINLTGITVHIGSQITDLSPMREAYKRLAKFVKMLNNNGFAIKNIDLGGGIGVTYEDEIQPCLLEYANIVKEEVSHLNCKIIIEPGRSISANSGALISSVMYIKKGIARNFMILDAAMNDLMRPSLYDAYHPIIPVKETSDKADTNYDIVGPICESGDVFIKGQKMAEILPNELMAIMVSGAYGAVMSSNYNTRPLIPEIMVKGNKFAVIRERQTVEDLLKWEKTPDWI